MSEVRQRQKKKETVEPENVAIKYNDSNRTTRRNSVSSLRIFSRMAVVFSLLTIVYFTSKADKFKPFAKQSEDLAGKGLVVKCSPEYMSEIYKYPGCFPKECKRYVADKIVSASEVSQLLEIAKKGLQLGGSSGGASILDLHSGALSLDQHFINIYKTEEGKNVFDKNDFNLYKVVKQKIKLTVAHHFELNPDKLYLTHPTFFSQITPKDAVTLHDEYWHPHVDKETYKSFHYTTLLYLSDFNVDFQGGRFVFVDEKFNRTIEPKRGRISMFTSGSENLHYVEKVTKGTRYAITISFTCDKGYAIEDPSINKFQLNVPN